MKLYRLQDDPGMLDKHGWVNLEFVPMTLPQLWDNATTASQRNLILLRSGLSLYDVQHRCKSYFLQWTEVHPMIQRRIQNAWDENKYSDLVESILDSASEKA